MTRNDHDAQDIVQESYLRAFRFVDGYRGGDGKSWLMAIVRNTFSTWCQRKRRDRANQDFDDAVYNSRCRAVDQNKQLDDAAKVELLRTC